MRVRALLWHRCNPLHRRSSFRSSKVQACTFPKLGKFHKLCRRCKMRQQARRSMHTLTHPHTHLSTHESAVVSQMSTSRARKRRRVGSTAAESKAVVTKSAVAQVFDQV